MVTQGPQDASRGLFFFSTPNIFSVADSMVSADQELKDYEMAMAFW